MKIQVFGNENSSQANAYSQYSNYSYSGLIPNERTLKVAYDKCVAKACENTCVFKPSARKEIFRVVLSEPLMSFGIKAIASYINSIVCDSSTTQVTKLLLVFFFSDCRNRLSVALSADAQCQICALRCLPKQTSS